MDFDAQNFDYEAEFQKIKEAVAKPNILVTGATGAGKSSLINHLFGEEKAPVGEGRPVTKGILPYSSPNLSVNLYDSQGYEVEDCNENYEYRNNVLGFIDERKGSSDIETHIHEVWHCISASVKRVTDMDVDIIGEIKKRNLPVVVVFTQIDGVDEAELSALVRRGEEAREGVAHFAVCCVKDNEAQERLKGYLQWTELLEWATANLDDALREGFISSLKGSLNEKRDLVLGKIIPMYTAIASGVGAVPIPFSDAFALIPLQVKMSMHIMNAYGLDNMTGVTSRAIESCCG
jgi:GTP-binding protein EngB required for normal cell division